VKCEAQPINLLVALGVERLSDQPIDDITKRGTVFHEHYYGENAVPYIDNGHMGLTVWCKDDAGSTNGNLYRFCLALTMRQTPPFRFTIKSNNECWFVRVLDIHGTSATTMASL